MKVKKNKIQSILILVLFLLSISNSYTQNYVAENGKAFFKAKISFNSYTGTSNQLTGFIDFNTGILEFSIPSKSIETPNKKRNKHMYELIKTDEHKTVSFKGNLIDLYEASAKGKQTLKTKGSFTLAGVTKEITLTIDLIQEQNGVRLNATWFLLITDYGLERPSKAFLTVDDKHEIGVEALLVKE